MSKPLEYIETLYNNPFLFTPIFFEFYRSLEWKPNSIVLSYLVLPLVLYPASQAYLTNARSNSRIRTMLKDKSRIYGLVQRMEELKTVTNESIQYALDSGVLVLSKELSVRPEKTSMSMLLPKLSKPAKNLAMLFNPYDIATVYRMLGVKEV